MAELVFIRDGQEVWRHHLNNMRCEIATEAFGPHRCDVLLREAEAPGVHVTVEKTADGHQLVNRADVPMLVNGQPATTRMLQHKDQFQLGSCAVIYSAAERPERGNPICQHA